MLRSRAGTGTVQVGLPRCTCQPNASGQCCTSARCGCRKAGRVCSAMCQCQRRVWQKAPAAAAAPPARGLGLVLCDGHREPASRLVIGAGSPDEGRAFYKCARAGGPCGFFMWAPDEGGVRAPEPVPVRRRTDCLNDGRSLPTMAGAGRAGRGMKRNKRRRPPAPKTNKAGLKACELGKDCPFQHEHQHTSEYHHDGPSSSSSAAASSSSSSRVVSFSGQGRRLGSGSGSGTTPRPGTTNGAASGRAAFSGAGHRLGSGTGSGPRAAGVGAGGSHVPPVRCGFCNQMIPAAIFTAHRTQHERDFGL